MPAQNSLMHSAIKDLDKKFAKRLGEIVQTLAGGDEDKKNENKRRLFFEVEPFAREFDEYPTEPLVRDNYDEYAEWINRRRNSVEGQGLKKYRAMFFGWLCYYHHSEAKALVEKFDAVVPLYTGHPELTDCSDEAKMYFRKQEQIQNEVEPIPIVTDQKPEVDDSNQLDASSDIEAPAAPRKKLSPVILSLVAAIVLAGTGFALYSLGLFALPKLASTTTVEPAREDNDPDITTQDPSSSGDEARDDNVSQDNNGAEKENAEEELAQETSPPPQAKPVNPVWDKITASEWSTKPLSYFYPFVRRANNADLLAAARAGNANAQTLAGIGYHVGLLGKVDHGLELRQYLEPACNSGQGRACTLIGVHYRSNKMGVKLNNQTAASYYERGCKLGNQTGCNYSGVRSSLGQGVPLDPKRAVAAFRQSCDAGSGYGCINLAEAYVFGRGVPQDIEQARQLWARGQQLSAPQKYPDFDQMFTISSPQQ